MPNNEKLCVPKTYISNQPNRTSKIKIKIKIKITKTEKDPKFSALISSTIFYNTNPSKIIPFLSFLPQST
jgi:hypothetical protein